MLSLDLMQWSGSLKTRRSETSQQVFDIVRRRWVALTPEELVRQLLVHYLHHTLRFPLSRMSVEKQLTVLGLTRRYDLVLFNQQAKPVLLAECKAPVVPLNQSVLDQAARYNMELQVPYLLVTNGRQAYCAHINIENAQWDFLPELPALS